MMTDKETKTAIDEPVNAYVILSSGCRIINYNKDFEKIFGSEAVASGKFCIALLAGDSACASCMIENSGDYSDMTVFSGDRVVNGKKYRLRFKRIIYGKDIESIVVGRIMDASVADEFIIKSAVYFHEYISTLESVKVLPWKLDLRDYKLYNQFEEKLVFGPGLSSVNFEAWLELIHPDDRLATMPALVNFFDGAHQVFETECRVADGSGGWRWIRVSGNVKSSGVDGKPVELTGYILDTTVIREYEEQKREKEQKLRDSESRLKNAMKLGRMSPWEYIFSRDCIITDRQLSIFWGYGDYYEKNEPIGREQLEQRVHPEDRPYVLEQFNKAITSGEGFEMIFRIVVDGRIKHVHFISEAVFEDERPVKLVGIAQDLTSLRMLESSLERKDEGLRFITERIGIGLWDFNIPELKLYLMSNEHRPGGIEEAPFVIHYDHLIKKLHPEDVSRCTQWFETMISGSNATAEIEFRYKTGPEYKWFHIAAVVSGRDSEEKSVAVRGLYQDITERKDIETKLYQSQKMEAIGRLAGGVAHDFNNILQVILGYGSLALMDVDNGSEMFEYISSIVDSGEKARNLVRQLLLFARREKFKPELIYINELISGLIMMLKRVIGENIVLNFTPDSDIGNIFGDSGQLEQIIMNLCINARDAAAGPGSIIIRTKDVVVDESWPCFDSEILPGHYVMVSVTDNGAGIPPENLDRIFEPFFTTKGKHRGTGLGLATTYAIVKQHRGYIDLHSIMGKGSTFSIYFPVHIKGVEFDMNEKNISADDYYSGNGTILIAEDDELIRKYTCRILEDSGFNVIAAANGVEAVELYKNNIEAVDLLLLDVIMPKMNGWDVYNTIRGSEIGIPVVFFSGYDENLLPGKFNSDMPMRYVQKPFKYYTLIKAIQELLEKKNI